MRSLEAKEIHFDIDKYLNPYIPRNRVARLPKPISHFLGHRESPRKEIGNLLIAAWSFLGAFVGVVVIEAFFKIPAIYDHGVPLLIGSFVRCSFNEPKTTPLTMDRVRQPYSNTIRSSPHWHSLVIQSSDTPSPLL